MQITTNKPVIPLRKKLLDDSVRNLDSRCQVNQEWVEK